MKRHLLSILLLLSAISPAFSQSVTLPYYTGFDSPSELAGWQEFRTGFLSTFSWSNSSGGGFSGGCISHDYNVGGGSGDTVIDWFVSPPINFTAPAKIAIKLNTSGFSSPIPDNCEIWFGTGIPDPAFGNYTLIANLSFMAPSSTWLDTITDIPFTSDSGYVAFKYKTIGAAWKVYLIDNVNISLDSTLSVFENKNPAGNSLSVFPNPFRNSTKIIFDEKLLNASSELRVYDNLGNEVRRISINNKNKFELNREDLVNGVYLISLVQDGKTIASRRFVVE